MRGVCSSSLSVGRWGYARLALGVGLALSSGCGSGGLNFTPRFEVTAVGLAGQTTVDPSSATIVLTTAPETCAEITTGIVDGGSGDTGSSVLLMTISTGDGSAVGPGSYTVTDTSGGSRVAGLQLVLSYPDGGNQIYGGVSGSVTISSGTATPSSGVQSLTLAGSVQATMELDFENGAFGDQTENQVNMSFSASNCH